LAAVALKLHPGEQIVFEGHPSWRSIIDFYLKGLAAVAVVCLLVALATSDAGLVIVIAIVGTAAVVLAGLIKRTATTYTITDRRLNIKRGIISRDVQETRLERVQNVNYSQGAVQRMLQIGDVDFDTAAGDDYNFIFTGVANPADVVHRVDEATGMAGPLGEMPGPYARAAEPPPSGDPPAAPPR
jgi:uncharacterized membrane protein YdbT with pleckstrin-like domain